MDSLLELMYAFRFTNIDTKEKFEHEFAFELKKEFMWNP
jgi:hypothetical protein